MSIQSSTATMSEDGEKTCPLCAEEMDLTDQHLKPCKCGYEICVWCWHHIMDMAEKDQTEGRCPACRNLYNKEKIVGMGANCERLVSDMNVEKKLKSQKGKSKTSEGRKQLGSVRVIQRNLVYVVGLPLNFADEDRLQRREYFGQYGKVLKVSISRTTAGAIQHFANSTCSVYISFASEEEAFRCIQSVHGFVLDGRSLRACFGTTKYCHAWLRNVPCSNPDCLYLHEIGSQEDSFTKDEIISAYARSRVQQITRATNCTQWCSGNLLPPPADEYCNNCPVSSGTPTTKTAINTTNSASVRFSPPNSSSGRSASLPAGASWGARASNNQPSSTSTPCFNGQNPDACNGPVAFSTAVASPSQVSSSHSDTGKKLVPIEECNMTQDKSELEILDPIRKKSDTNETNTVSESSSASVHSSSVPITRAQPNTSDIVDSSLKSGRPAVDEDFINGTDGNMENIYSNISSLSIHGCQHLQHGYVEKIGEPLTSQASGRAADMSDEVCGINVQTDLRLGMPTLLTQVDLHEMEDGLLSFDDQRLEDSVVAANRSHTQDFSHSFHPSKHSNICSQFNNADGLISVDLDRQVVNREGNLIVSGSNSSCGRPENILNSPEVNDVEYSIFFPSKDKKSLLGRYEAEVAIGAGDMGESSIISNILSMDCDSWAESLTSPQNLAKLFGETDNHQGSFGITGSWKIQNSNQSRFSFAREEEPVSQVSDSEPSIDYFEESFKQRPFGHDFSNSNSLYLEKFATHNGFPVFNGTEPDIFASNNSHISSSKLSVSRSQITAPPGFSMPTRAAPPDFTSNDRTEQNLDMLFGNSMLDASFLLRNQYQTLPSGNTVGNGDIELMDPAILEVGRGTFPGGVNGPGLDARPGFSSQSGTLEEGRFQSFSQKSLPPHQKQRFIDLGNTLSPFGDAYGIPSRVAEQTLANNISPFSQYTPQSRNAISSNGQWDGWNDIQGGNNLGMAELLRNERLGFNKFYSGYEDSKIRMPNSGYLYNGTYGI